MDELTESVDEMLTFGERSEADPVRVRLHLGCDEMVFALGGDNQWRMCVTLCYGTPTYPHGPGCDASGYRLSEEQVEAVTRFARS